MEINKETVLCGPTGTGKTPENLEAFMDQINRSMRQSEGRVMFCDPLTDAGRNHLERTCASTTKAR